MTKKRRKILHQFWVQGERQMQPTYIHTSLCIECSKSQLVYMSVHRMQRVQLMYMSVHRMQQVQLVHMSMHRLHQAQLVLHVRASNAYGCSGEREGETPCTRVSTLSTWTSHKSTRHLQYCYGHVYWSWINTYISNGWWLTTEANLTGMHMSRIRASTNSWK